MQPKTKTMRCRRCLTPMQVGAQVVNPPRCFDCGIADAISAMRQMQAKSGPVYDRYVMGTRMYAERIARTNKV